MLVEAVLFQQAKLALAQLLWRREDNQHSIIAPLLVGSLPDPHRRIAEWRLATRLFGRAGSTV